jgi:hypothetical protein
MNFETRSREVLKEQSFHEVSMSTASLPDDPQLRERFSELKPPLTPRPP